MESKPHTTLVTSVGASLDKMLRNAAAAGRASKGGDATPATLVVQSVLAAELVPTAPPLPSALGESGASLRTRCGDRSATPSRCGGMAATTSQRVAEARQRVLESRKLDVANKAQQLEESRLRLAEADRRREQLGDRHAVQRSLCMSTAVCMAAATAGLLAAVATARSRRAQPLRLLPHVLLRVRHPLRRARLRLYGGAATRPTVPQLRADKMLNLFSDQHLQHCINHMELRYYFENETIVFQGSEDDESYVVCEGHAAVVVGSTCVFTVRAGMSFGTVGMISGEPRTASVVARAPCLVWCLSRRHFDAYGPSSSDQGLVARAHEIIADMRESNMRNVYESLLKPAFLRTFPTLQGVADETLSSVAAAGTPNVLPSGTCVYGPSMPAAAAPHLLVLRGVLRLTFTPLSSSTLEDSVGAHPTASFAEQVSHIVDLPIHPRAGLTADRATGHRTIQSDADSSAARTEQWAAAVKGAVSDGPCTVVQLRGPLLLNMAPVLLPAHDVPFVVEALGDCDVVAFPKDALLGQDVLELAVMRQNAHNLRCPFMAVPPACAMLKAILHDDVGLADPHGTASADALRHLVSRALPQEPLPHARWVYGRGDFVQFTANDDGDMEFLLVLAGELENAASSSRSPSLFMGTPSPPSPPARASPSTAQRYPFIWPALPSVYYGCGGAVSRVASPRLEVVKLCRRDLLKLLLTELDEPTLTELAMELAQRYVASSGRRPVFNESGIADLARHPRFATIASALPLTHRNSSVLHMSSPSASLAHLRKSIGHSPTPPPLHLNEPNSAFSRAASTTNVSSCCAGAHAELVDSASCISISFGAEEPDPEMSEVIFLFGDYSQPTAISRRVASTPSPQPALNSGSSMNPTAETRTINEVGDVHQSTSTEHHLRATTPQQLGMHRGSSGPNRTVGLAGGSGAQTPSPRRATVTLQGDGFSSRGVINAAAKRHYSPTSRCFVAFPPSEQMVPLEIV